MIFKLPYSWLKEYVQVPPDPHVLARELSLYGPSVERVVPVRHEFTGVVVGEIIAIRPHPHADKLLLATVRVGPGKTREIVCGAPNIAVGQKVPVALVGARLPGGLSIGRRKVRSVVSDGMLCSARELGLHDEHLGILILPPRTPLGRRLADLGAAADYLLEVEPTTNRPDIHSVLGVAREVSAITKKPLPWPPAGPRLSRGRPPVRVRVIAKKLCPRFVAVYIAGVRVGPSPWLVQERLSRAGIRPINNVVDITNYLRLELGQPLHAFDADKLGPEVVVRLAQTGEKLLALDGRTYALRPHNLVVADRQRPVGLAGIMGGDTTSVTDATTNVLLEAASWDPVSIRRTSRELNLATDSSRLFEKGLSIEGPTIALERAIALAEDWCSGRQRGAAVDVRARPYRSVRVRLPLAELERTLGVSLSRVTVASSLRRLGFAVANQSSAVTATVPYWRDHDVSAPEDLVEEVARLYGYHRLGSRLPPVAVGQFAPASTFTREDELRSRLTALGMNETYSYSFIPKRWVQALRYPLQQTLKIANPLSEDWAYLRPSLLPSLVSVLASNESYQSEVMIFEIAKVYRRSAARRAATLDAYREEEVRAVGLLTLEEASPEELFRTVRGLVDAVAANTSLPGRTAAPYPFAAGCSVEWQVALGTGSFCAGSFGLLDPAFLAVFGVKRPVAAFDAPLECLSVLTRRLAFQTLPKYPSAKRDVALVVSEGIDYNKLVSVMRRSSPLLRAVELFDVYRGRSLPSGTMSLAMHLVYRADDRTLTAAEVEGAYDALVAVVAEQFKARVRLS